MFAFRCEGRAPLAARGRTQADTDRARAEASSIWSVIVPADGTSAAHSDKRKFRHVLILRAALGQSTTFARRYNMGRPTQSTRGRRRVIF